MIQEYIKKRKAELEKLTEKFITDNEQDEIYARQDELNKLSSQLEPQVMPNFVNRVSLTDEQLDDIYIMVKNWDNEKSKNRAIEELLELALTFLHIARNKANYEDLRKEMADVRLALEHLEFKYGNYQKELNEKLEKYSKISA